MPAKQIMQRTIRVFVSSTFRDMHEERDELITRIFPRLRRLCEQRQVVWGEVDLRWGITDEEKAEGKVLPACLEEIHRCRPYFIGLLGERYGWVPDEIPQELIEREEWLKEHLHKSVTELEILHGVLNNPEMADHAFFYFRGSAYVDSIPKDKQSDFREGPSSEEIEKYGQAEAERRADERKGKLAMLKARIKAEKGPYLRENYKGPSELGKLVLDDLTAVIDKLFPAGSEPDPLDREAADHEAFAQSRFKVYIGRKEYFDKLNEHAESDAPPLVVLGESGSGKSALLANWAMKYREKHPDELFIMHFIGATPYATDWMAMLRRIMGEFKRRYDIQGDTPDKPDALRLAFANWLSMADKAAEDRGEKIVIILDALNQLEDKDGAPDLVWLPPTIPTNIRLILSTLPGRPLDDLQKRGRPTMLVKPLDREERKQLIIEYLAIYSHKLSQKHIDKIASAKQTSNPLYLRALLEELRVAARYEDLEEKIGHYLGAGDVPKLYELILARYEEDYNRERPGLVRDSMTLIWASRRGLSEDELLELLGEDGNRLPQIYWTWLSLAAEQALVNRGGYIGFFHDYMQQAVLNKYMPDEPAQNTAHLRLADYFAACAKLALTTRVIDEYPWQLAEGRAWQRLYDLLADLEFFEKVWQQNQFDVKAYWARVEGSSPLKMVTAYGKVLRKPSAFHANMVWLLGHLLADTGHPQEAFSICQYLTEYYRKSDDRLRMSVCLGNQGIIHRARGELDKAMRLYKEQEQICRELGDKAGLSTSLGSQGLIHNARGELDEAMKLHKEEERICRELGDKPGLQYSLGYQGLIHYDRGEFDEAMRLYKEQERICKELGDKAGLSISLGYYQGIIHHDRGELDEAMRLYKDQERICRELGDKSGLQASLGYQGVIHHDRGELDEAMRLYKEQERICRELGDKAWLQRSLGNQGGIHHDRGELDEAMRLWKEEERLCRELGDKAGLSRNHGNQGNIHYARGDLDEAMRLYKEQERICRKLGDKAVLQACLGNQGNIHKDRRELDKAMRLYREKERICEELGDPKGLAISLVNQSLVLDEKGHPKDAVRLAEEAYQLASKHGYAALVRQIKDILDDIRLRMK